MKLRGIVTGAVGLIVSASMLSGPAYADPTGGTETEGGYGAGANYEVTLSGDYSPGLRGSVPVPPPLCWWEPITGFNVDLDPSDPEAVKKYFYEEVAPYLTGHAGPGRLMYDDALFQKAIQAKKRGEDITWYRLELSDEIRSDSSSTADRVVESGCSTAAGAGEYQTWIAWNFFPTGNPPEPVVDPELLAEYAYEVMDLVSPALEWNPRIAVRDDASLVNLATWMWVDEPAAVSERSVTATAGPVSVTVTANTDGLSITSPAGTTQCTAEEAATTYTANSSEDSACTLTFDRASYGYADGFPVDASTVWQAEWTSTTGEAGALDARTVDETTNIPVAESQSLVNDVG